MADTEVTKFPANTTPTPSDLLHIIDDVTGTPKNQKIEVQDLVESYTKAAAETTAGVTPTNFEFFRDTPFYDVRRAGVVGDGLVDDTDAMRDSYKACKEGNYVMWLGSLTIKITGNLLWDDPKVTVRGASRKACQIYKFVNVSDYVAITLDNYNAGSISDFTILDPNQAGGTPPAAASGHGIHLTGEFPGVSIERVTIDLMTGSGIFLDGTAANTGTNGQIRHCIIQYCGVDGIKGDDISHFYVDNVNIFGNVGWGVDLPADCDFWRGNVTVQNNTEGGIRIAGQQNHLDVYGESNIGPDIELTSASIQNLIIDLHSDLAPGDLTDLGTRNIIISPSVASVGGVFSEFFSRPQRTTNVAGLPVALIGGEAGAGASPFSGGVANVLGGSAAGTGNAGGGNVVISGGDPVGTGFRGIILMQKENAGAITLGANLGPTNDSLIMDFLSTTRVLKLPVLTTTQRDALTPTAGMLIYNSTTTQLEDYNGTTWAAVHEGSIIDTNLLDKTADEDITGDWTLHLNNPIEGYSTGRNVLRSATIRIQPGATPGTNINVTSINEGISTFNTPTITDTTDLGKSGSGGSFTLSANGEDITLDMTEAVVGLLMVVFTTHDINNSSTSEMYTARTSFSSGNLILGIVKRGASANVDWTSITSAGDIIDMQLSFITST